MSLFCTCLMLLLNHTKLELPLVRYLSFWDQEMHLPFCLGSSLVPLSLATVAIKLLASGFEVSWLFLDDYHRSFHVRSTYLAALHS
jgi:hypothetical protein